MKRFLILSGITAILAGCASRDIEVKTAITTPDRFENASLAGAEVTDDASWWASFGDPQLCDLILKALANNRSLKASEAAVRQAGAASSSARSTLFPTLGLVGQLASEETLINPDGTTQAESWGLGAQWELDIFGQNRNQARAAAQLAYATEEEYRAARMMVASSTANTYLTWLNVRARTVVLLNAITVQKHTLELVNGRLPEGLSSTFDVDRAKASLAATEAMMPKLDMAENKLRNALAVLTGQPPQELVLQNTDWDSVRVPQPPVLLPSTVLLRRPDVQAAQRTVRAQMYAVGAAKAAYYPKFNFSLVAQAQQLQFSVAGMPSLNGPVSAMALDATLPIFTAGKIRAAVRGQEARLDAVAALYENTILEAVADVENAYKAYSATNTRLASLQNSADSAASAAESIDGLYEGGLADMTDVLSTRTACMERADALLQGSLEYALAAVSLHDALGGFSLPQ